MSKIVALDFETANKRSASAISVGYAVIEENLITDYKNFLIKPEPEYNEFLKPNMRIHHITPKMVENKPTFGVIYDQYLKDVLQDAYLVAHGAAWDMRVLKSLFRVYNINTTNFKFLCTVDISTNLWPDLENHKLPTVAEALNYELKNHHDAMFDALACAKIVTAAMKDCDTTDFFGLAFSTNSQIGTILNTKDKGWCDLRHFTPDINNLKKYTEGDYEDHPYNGKKIAKMGDFTQMSDEYMAQHLANVNGVYTEEITDDTDIAVLADKYYSGDMKPKHIKAKLEQAKEKNIDVISEYEFKEELFSCDYMDNDTGFPKYEPEEYL